MAERSCALRAAWCGGPDRLQHSGLAAAHSGRTNRISNSSLAAASEVVPSGSYGGQTLTRSPPRTGNPAHRRMICSACGTIVPRLLASPVPGAKAGSSPLISKLRYTERSRNRSCRSRSSCELAAAERRQRRFQGRLGGRDPCGLGQMMHTRAPPNIDEPIDTSPWCHSTARLTIASPRP